MSFTKAFFKTSGVCISAILSSDDVELARNGPFGRLGKALLLVLSRGGEVSLHSDTNVPSYDMTETDTGMEDWGELKTVVIDVWLKQTKKRIWERFDKILSTSSNNLLKRSSCCPKGNQILKYQNANDWRFLTDALGTLS